MNEIIKEYNSYLDQIGMILHPNLLGAFLKIHNQIVAAEVEKARLFKPSKEWVELKKTIDEMKALDNHWKTLYMKRIVKQINELPIDKGW
jgi:hypothetical protein